jgi:hypothetical protein
MVIHARSATIVGELMLRTIGVLIAGTFLGALIFGGLGWVMSGHSTFSVQFLYLLEALTGITIGLFVGFSRIKYAGLVAVLCPLPPLFLEYRHMFSRPSTGLRLALLLLGTGLKLSLAFAVAHKVSRGGKSSSDANRAGLTTRQA